MIFNAESACTYRSACKTYQLVWSAAGFSIDRVDVMVDGELVKPFACRGKQKALDLAMGWCADHAAGTSETQFQPTGSDVR